MILFGIVSESFHRSHIRAVAFWFRLRKPGCKKPSEKFAGASSKSEPVGKIVLAVIAV